MDPLQNLDGFLQALLAAFTSGNWSLVAVLATVGGVALARWILVKRWPYFQTDEGGTLLALVGGFAGAVALAVTGGTPLLAALVPALLTAWAAQGGWQSAKRLLLPRLVWLLGKLGLNLGNGAALKEAEAAGDEAVKENPAPGAGDVRDVE